jgi:DNA-binding XRE family transcriptional regulator
MKRNLPKVVVDTERFREYLKYRKTNVSEVARKVGVSRRYLYGCLDAGEMSLLTALDICELFDCRIEVPFGKQDHMAIGKFVRKVADHL